MNEGYISMIILVVILILLASGWRTTLFKNIPPAALSAFFILWFIGMLMQLSYADSLQVQGIYLPLLAIVWAAVRYADWPSALLALLTGLLTGVIGYFVQSLYTLNPSLVVINPRLDLAILLAFLTYTVSRTPIIQTANLAIALIVADISQWQLAGAHEEQLTLLGGPGFQDLWWLSLVAIRVIAMLIEGAIALTQLWLKHVAIWFSGNKK